MNLKRLLLTFLAITIVLLAAPACQSVEPIAPSPLTSPTSAPPLEDAIETPPLFPIEREEPALRETALPDTLGEENEQQPLRFTFPQSVGKPESLWRPPLYDVPFGLGPHDHFLFVRPIAADEVNWPLADYRYGGIFPGSNPPIVHTGIDIPNARGTPVLAAGPGKVVWAGYGLFNRKDRDTDPYGLAVAIRHDFGYENRSLYTVYAHMDRIDVIEGQRAETGTQLGVIGTTGFTTGPHLHFEVRIETNSFYATRNPELWIVPPQGWGALVGRMLNSNGSLLTKQTLTVQSIETGRKWSVISYGETTVISDDYYRENVVLSDLPKGRYRLSVDYLEEKYTGEVVINPGAITYFTFKGKFGFDTQAPRPSTEPDWLVSTPPVP